MILKPLKSANYMQKPISYVAISKQRTKTASTFTTSGTIKRTIVILVIVVVCFCF